MAQIEGMDPEQLDEQADELEQVVAAVLAAVAAAAAAQMIADIPAALLGTPAALAFISLDDLAVIGTLWDEATQQQLMPIMRQIFDQSTELIRDQVAELIEHPQLQGLPEGVPSPLPSTPDAIPEPDDILAEDLMLQARNRLRGIGDQLWFNARQQLSEGIAAGDSVPQLAARVRLAANVTEPRSRTIARTEVVSISNNAAIAQARQLKVPMTKDWLDTDDDRTRPTHVEAGRTQQRVPIDQPFSVGGFELDFPGDPTGPPQEVINERCGVGFNLDLSEAVTASIFDAHLPGKHDQREHGRKKGVAATPASEPKTSTRKQAAPKKQPPTRSKTPAATRDLIKDPSSVATVLKRAEEMPGVKRRHGFLEDSTGGDVVLASVAAEQGFDAPMETVSAAQFRAMVKDGTVGTVMYRGVQGGGRNVTAGKIMEQLRSGKLRGGLGTFGNGIYMGVGRSHARAYSDKTPGSLAKFGLRADARVVAWDDILKEYEDWYVETFGAEADYTQLASSPEYHAYGDVGRYGIARGYDAIFIPKGTNPGIGAEAQGDQYNILNRGAMIAEAPNVG